MVRPIQRTSATSQKAGNHDLDDPPILDPDSPRANANADANLSSNQDVGLAVSSGSDGVVLHDQLDEEQDAGLLDGILEEEHENGDDEVPGLGKIDGDVPTFPKNSSHDHSSVSNKSSIQRWSQDCFTCLLPNQR